ncbi:MULTISPECIES: CGNR zinc finger domain-containing protein [unclassified Streptomyces]|uniref:CGNR zinc finger domain-containing protein n=1 Tax=unclassified Streptomyces TaxID=2593676 RepID=UPI00036AA55B|nr:MULTISPECIES: CGNR zinc finger domain-containing protein [unclassified Streptomyces]MYQ78321.1 hypothetical protein [Streptomyces sp. SID4923]
MERWPALELASTIRHDGDGGVADDLATVEGATRWIQERSAADLVADEPLRLDLIELRQAVRALFARAVSPAPASPADAHRLMPAAEATARLNAAAAREPVAPQLDWPDEGVPAVRLLSDETAPSIRLLASLARDAINFLSGPQRTRLRSCTAPRCVRYFIKSHGRQEWCKPSCGNRARAARHYRRQRGEDGGAPS